MAEYIFFSSEHGTFSRTDHKLGHKPSLSKFKRTEIISSIFSDHNSVKLEISYRKKNEKRTNTWTLNNMLLKNQWVNKGMKEEIRKYIETNENGNTTFHHNFPKSMECSKSSSKKEVYSNTGLPEETRKISNKQHNLSPKGFRKRTKRPKVSKRQEIIKIKEEIKIETKSKKRKDQ